MQLTPIDKPLYNKRIKITFFSMCAYMLVMGLGISTTLIFLLGKNEGDNFWLNATGALLAGLSLYAIYLKVKEFPYFKDIVFVRSLKAQLNYIYRKQRKILIAAEQGDTTAMAILDFSYKTSQFIFELDDNTLTMEELAKSRQQLQIWIEQYQVVDLVPYHRDLLKAY